MMVLLILFKVLCSYLLSFFLFYLFFKGEFCLYVVATAYEKAGTKEMKGCWGTYFTLTVKILSPFYWFAFLSAVRSVKGLIEQNASYKEKVEKCLEALIK